LGSTIYMFSKGIDAALYAIASFYLLPSPPIKGLTFLGNVYLILFIIFTLTLPVSLITYFLKADKNSSGSVKRAPQT